MIDWTKPIRTVEGEPARFLGVVKPSPHTPGTYLVAISCGDGQQEAVERKNADGTAAFGVRIVNVPLLPKKRKVFVNVYANEGYDCVRLSKRDADVIARTGRLACVELTYEVPAE